MSGFVTVMFGEMLFEEIVVDSSGTGISGTEIVTSVNSYK